MGGEGLARAGADRGVVLVRSGVLALLAQVFALCAARLHPVELVSTDDAPLALSLPAAVASDLDVWTYVDKGGAAWEALVSAVGAVREVLVRGRQEGE